MKKERNIKKGRQNTWLWRGGNLKEISPGTCSPDVPLFLSFYLDPSVPFINVITGYGVGVFYFYEGKNRKEPGLPGSQCLLGMLNSIQSCVNGFLSSLMVTPDDTAETTWELADECFFRDRFRWSEIKIFSWRWIKTADGLDANGNVRAETDTFCTFRYPYV